MKKALFLLTTLLATSTFLSSAIGSINECLVSCSEPDAGDSCTIGVASGSVTVDGRPILWKVRDTGDKRQLLVHSSGYPYNYIGVKSEDGGVFMGLNEAGVASGNSAVSSPAGSGSLTEGRLQRDILRNYDSIDQIRDFIQSEIDSGNCNSSGCFPFIDVDGNAVVFEINRSNWILEYDSMEPERDVQALLGFVVRANEFHERNDGTDDITIVSGRYESGMINISGLIAMNELLARTVIQGSDDPNRSYEFVRYGPGRALATISRPSNRSTIVVHGVAPDEDPALATMWVILGQSNYGIAVPTWVKVFDIPQCLGSGEMYDRAKSLYNKGNEMATQSSIFPFEAHMFDVVDKTLLPHWRAKGIPTVEEMTRIEHQMTNDAYSLLDCLDNHQNNNKAPEINFVASPDEFSLHFSLITEDQDGSIAFVLWDFGDGMYSEEPSPFHIYNEPGTYLVSCTITDDDNVSVTDWRYYTLPLNCDIVGDDDFVGFADLSCFFNYWLETNCGEPDWCDGADFDRNSNVDFVDLAIFARRWLVNVMPM